VDALGWSMGAAVWWSYLDLFGSSRVRTLVVVDQPSAVAALPHMSAEDAAACGAVFELPQLAGLIGALLGPDADEVLLSFARTTYTGEIPRWMWELQVAQMRTVPAYAAVPLLFDHCAQDWRDVVRRIDVPTLVIGCEGSHVPPESQRSLARQIPGGRAHVFTADVASSHFPFLQAPAEFNAVVSGFLG